MGVSEKHMGGSVEYARQGALQKQLQYLQLNSPYYQRIFREQGIDVSGIDTVEGLAGLPVTTKAQLQAFNQEFLCVPTSAVADYVTTSGTMGEPVTFALTGNDLNRLAHNEAVALACAGCTNKDVIQLACTIDKRFMAGLAYYLGARKLGAATIRVGAGEPALQWDSVKRFSPTVLITVPSFLLKMIAYAQEKGIDFRQSSVQKVICIGEPVRDNDFNLNTLGQRITQQWNVELYSTYASTEMSTAYTECAAHQGGHEISELIVTEVLDENNEPVADGQPGEVTVTTLGVEGMPLLRFKTGDICCKHTVPCSCGRDSLRLGPVLGRREQMIKYKGTTLFPESIFNALNALEEVENYLVELNTDDVGNDEVCIKLGTLKGNEDNLRAHLKSSLRVTPKILLMTPADLTAVQGSFNSRKTVKLIDNRNKKWAGEN